MNELPELPAGYLDVDGVAVHLAEVRRHSTDVHRFQRLLPVALEVTRLQPQSPEWCAVIDRMEAADRPALAVTLQELGAIRRDAAEALRGAAR